MIVKFFLYTLPMIFSIAYTIYATIQKYKTYKYVSFGDIISMIILIVLSMIPLVNLVTTFVYIRAIIDQEDVI